MILDNHPQREEITRRILAGESATEIAKTCNPPCNKSTITRFRNQVIAPAVGKMNVKNKLIQKLDGTEPKAIREWIEQDEARRRELRDPLLEHASSSRDCKGFAAVSSDARASNELLARLAGILGPDSAGQGATVQIAVFAGGPTMEPEVIDVTELGRR